MTSEFALGDIIVLIGTIFGLGITLPILLQFVNNVSRNISLTNQNSTEEISKAGNERV